MNTVKLEDIARELNLSVSTVSRAISGKGRVGDRTRARVQAAVRESGYRINDVARSLRMQKAQNMGIIVPDMTSDYYSRLVHTLNERFRQNGYATLFSVTDFDEKVAIRAIGHMAQMRVSCLLIVMDDIEAVSQKLIDSVRLTLLPVMFVRSRHIDLLEADCLFVDEEHGNPLRGWLDMGEPASLTEEQREFLRGMARPYRTSARAQVSDGRLTVSLKLRPNAVSYCRIEPVQPCREEGYDASYYQIGQEDD